MMRPSEQCLVYIDRRFLAFSAFLVSFLTHSSFLLLLFYHQKDLERALPSFEETSTPLSVDFWDTIPGDFSSSPSIQDTEGGEETISDQRSHRALNAVKGSSDSVSDRKSGLSTPGVQFLGESDQDLDIDWSVSLQSSGESPGDISVSSDRKGPILSDSEEQSELPDRESRPVAGDLSQVHRHVNLRGVWKQSRRERHQSHSIHQGALSLYFLKLNERLLSHWGGVRFLPQNSRFIGRHRELISYEFLISPEGELLGIRNVSQIEQPQRDFSDVDRLVEEVFRSAFPFDPPPMHTEDPILFRKEILYLRDSWHLL